MREPIARFRRVKERAMLTLGAAPSRFQGGAGLDATDSKRQRRATRVPADARRQRSQWPTTRVKLVVNTRLWHGRTTAAKSDEYLHLMRTVAIPDYRATPGNQGAYALRRIEGDVAHFLMLTFWESEDAIRAFAGDDITVAKYYDFDKDFLLEMEPTSTHYETFDR
jgi:heme-degrading monooxygenase HmoA